ncbi:winged helix-turn-helix transcriptional regulator [Sphingosinicella terrae]|uniref:winged helix-turn-helix transcriptional regulator n=1 Tax=Sphingosinicella terrae TaxID=2172047 RepID=UPI000E0D008A|nr:helix-turn-helix domain-containing protein [Sphingosinicella terrae]
MSGARYDQFCALARAAELLGERWTLLIVRELLLGPKRFADLASHLQGVSPTVLSARLSALTERGLIRKVTLPPPVATPVYELTAAGEGLRPAIRELIRWGGQFLFPTRPGEVFEPAWALLALDAIARRTPTPPVTFRLHLVHGGKAATFRVEGGPSGTSVAAAGEGAFDAAIETGFETLLQILSGAVPVATAIADGSAVVEGPDAALRVLPDLFDLAERRTGAGGTGRNEERD